MRRELATVTRTAKRKRAGDDAYRAAVMAASHAGASLRTIAAAAGVTHNAIRHTLQSIRGERRH